MEVVLLVYRLIMSAAVVLFMPDTMAQVMINKHAMGIAISSAAMRLSSHTGCACALLGLSHAARDCCLV
jgi:hypothetical protein